MQDSPPPLAVSPQEVAWTERFSLPAAAFSCCQNSTKSPTPGPPHVSFHRPIIHARVNFYDRKRVPFPRRYPETGSLFPTRSLPPSRDDSLSWTIHHVPGSGNPFAIPVGNVKKQMAGVTSDVPQTPSVRRACPQGLPPSQWTDYRTHSSRNSRLHGSDHRYRQGAAIAPILKSHPAAYRLSNKPITMRSSNSLNIPAMIATHGTFTPPLATIQRVTETQTLFLWWQSTI